MHLSYLPIYILASKPLSRRSSAQIEDEHRDGTRQMYPGFDIICIESVPMGLIACFEPQRRLNYSNPLRIAQSVIQIFRDECCTVHSCRIKKP